MRLKVAAAVISGNGTGRPVGILHPNSSIPICDTASTMTPGEFAWQDLVALTYHVDEQWARVPSAAFLMNRPPLSLVLTMTDAVGMPIWTMMPDADAPGQFYDRLQSRQDGAEHAQRRARCDSHHFRRLAALFSVWQGCG